MDIPQELAGRFIVGAKLIERPSCVVYRGVDKELGNRAVAIKIFVDIPGERADWIAAFEREVSILRAASHPTLVPIISGGCENGRLYLAMELIEGSTLRDYLKNRETPIDAEIAVELISKVAAGLKEIHEKNGFHGHLDSRALLFKGTELRIAGYYPHIISEMQKGVTGQGRLTVDPAYVAPEQVTGEGTTDGRADIYALSVLLYEMITGTKPFVAENPMQLAMLRLTKEPEPIRKKAPNTPPIIEAAIMKGLTKNPSQRFANIAEFIDALTGGKKPLKNPLLEALGDEGIERLGGTETIAVSMSTEAIKHILIAHESQILAEKTAKLVGEVKTEAAVSSPKQSAKAETEAVAAASTVMGMAAIPELPASLVLVGGGELGKKYTITPPQQILGSDPSCGVVLTGAGVPLRLAIVVERSGSYFISSLSAAAVSINGKPLEGEKEQLLSRGDIIAANDLKLRFVAPGEVFTLKSDVADRVIDRAPSKLPKLIAAAAITLVVMCGALFYLYSGNITRSEQQTKVQEEKKKRERKQLIDTLRKEGDALFQAGSFILPVEANATKRFQQLLELDPEDTYAKRRLAEIEQRVKALSEQEARKKQFAEQVARLLADGERLLQLGNYISPPGANARESYQEVLRLDPQNTTAQTKLAEINLKMNDLVGQINSSLARARELIAQRSYTTPAGANAMELVKGVLRIDPTNADAKSMIIDMAARSIIEGDLAKMRKQPEEMRRAYLTAQTIGVNPSLVKRKLESIRTIEQATSSVVIVESGAKASEAERKDSRYLNIDEIEQRISQLMVENYQGMNDAERRVYEVQGGSKR